MADAEPETRPAMPTQIPEAETESAGASGPAAERSAHTFRFVAAVLAEMQRHGVPRFGSAWPR